MSDRISDYLSMSTAIGRWSAIGPYYAMFPREFAFRVVETYSQPGDAVLDPFAGRASSIYAAAVMDRVGLGMEINPVGWLYGHVKLKPALQKNVIKRLQDINSIVNSIDGQTLNDLPEFFRWCYSSTVLRYLLAARQHLNWRKSKVDATLMAIILVNLHGRIDNSLSNQMRQGKAMAPDYSVRWWKDKKLSPPELDPVVFLTKKIEWRYQKGMPNLKASKVLLGDSTLLIRKLANQVYYGQQKSFNLLFTSPPYYRLTNYHYDQWLRLWMLGGPEKPTWMKEKWQNRFESKTAYRDLLEDVFGGCANILDPKATIYVRTDARQFTCETTVDVLSEIFPKKSLQIVSQPFKKHTQTALFGDKSKKPGEIDIIMQS